MRKRLLRLWTDFKRRTVVFLVPGCNNDLASATANQLGSGLSWYKAGNRCPRDKASVHLMTLHKHRPRNHSNKPSGCTWLFLALPDCTRLHLALPRSAMIYLKANCHILPLTGLNTQTLLVDGLGWDGLEISVSTYSKSTALRCL